MRSSSGNLTQVKMNSLLGNDSRFRTGGQFSWENRTSVAGSNRATGWGCWSMGRLSGLLGLLWELRGGRRIRAGTLTGID